MKSSLIAAEQTIRLAFSLAVIIAALVAGVDRAAAQTDPSPERDQGSGAPQIHVPDPLTHEAIRDLLSELDDRQVRALLLERLTEQADARAAALADASARDVDELAAAYANAFGAFLMDVVGKIPAIPGRIEQSVANYLDLRGDTALSRLFLAIIASLGGGLIAALGVNRLVGRGTFDRRRRESVELWPRIGTLGVRLLRHLVHAVTFVAMAYLINLWFNADASADREFLGWIIAASGWTLVVYALARFILAPESPGLRLCTADDQTARFLTRRAVASAVLFNFGFGFASWMNDVGVAYSESWIGFWINLGFHVMVAVSVWQARDGIRGLVSDGAGGSRLAFAWPLIVIALLVLHWFLVELVVATSLDVVPGLFTAMATTLILVMIFPLLDRAVRAVFASMFPVHPDDSPALRAAAEETRSGLGRIGRVVALVLGVLLVLYLWGVDIVALAERGVGVAYASAVLNSLLIAALAYGVWELIRIITDRRIAMEKVALGMDKAEGDGIETEGGGEGARLGTILPLVRLVLQITVVVLAILAILGELGVNILPLLAGAGVVGLAIGFGAQTLVKDIVSGVFFLIDDAFRKGEYIDIGGVRGTVERISIRSMQLRHHTGSLNTVPFGDIRNVENFSRDWVIMKLSFRLTYDTDAEKVRKMIKKLGKELLEDPEWGPQFLQPLKSQGVVEMEDSAMIMRVKFMTRPGDQWVLRRIVFAKIRDLFEKNGVKFASREVVVRLEGDRRESELSESERQAVAGSAGRLVTDPKSPGTGTEQER